MALLLRCSLNELLPLDPSACARVRLFACPWQVMADSLALGMGSLRVDTAKKSSRELMDFDALSPQGDSADGGDPFAVRYRAR